MEFVALLLAPKVVPAVVQTIGFTSDGIAAGSTAASMMSVLGGGTTQAGGVVATCQSIGATGTIGNVPAMHNVALIGGVGILNHSRVEDVPADPPIEDLNVAQPVDNEDNNNDDLVINVMN